MEDDKKTLRPRGEKWAMPKSEETIPNKRIRKPDGKFAVGDWIMGRYNVLAELGQGGMGVVYRCFDKVAGIEVAIKTLSPELSKSGWEMETIKGNFQLVQQLHHPYIANYNNLEKDPVSDSYFLVMEYVDGEELRYFLRRKQKEGSFSEKLVIKLACQIAEALDYAHKLKIIHRDIKPANIMVDRNGDVKLLDFGLAAQIHSSLSKVTKDSHEDTSGTVPYMSPEQWICRPQTAASDQYALGATLYEVFSGHPPFDSADKDNVRHCALNVEPEMLTGVSPAIAGAIARALSKKPQDRFASCKEFAEALEGKNKAEPSVPEPVPAIPQEHASYLPGAAKETPAAPPAAPPQTSSSAPPVSVPEASSGNFFKGFTAVVLLAILACIAYYVFHGPRNVPTAYVPADTPARDAAAPSQPQVSVSPTSSEFNGTVDLPNGVKLELVKIKAGTFTMGSPESELGRGSDEKHHQVTLTQDYWLGKFEVTQAQWQAVMGSNPSYYKGDNRPVEWVSWNDAKEFCNKLNEKYAGKLPAGYKFDLPTEAQWEYACRAGTTTALNNGTDLTSDLGSCSNLNEVGWYNNNCGSSGGHKAVGQKRPNNWGLYDMHGNVWEWCRDWYASYSGDATDPVGPSSGSVRVLRGGSWLSFARNCRSAYRSSNSPGDRNSILGFRLALVPVQ